MEETDLHLCNLYDDNDNSTITKDNVMKEISFDMWGQTRIKNFKKLLNENKFLKSFRLKLFEEGMKFLNEINVEWFVYAGTALSVYRENGNIIAHDSDIDVAILEKDFSKVCSHLNELESKGVVITNCKSSLRNKSWFHEDGSEIPYDGVDCKRVKFYLNRQAWRDSEIPIEQELHRKLQSIVDPDPGLIHLDIFTFGVHPTVENSYRVNWSLPSLYDNSKAYSHDVLFPLRDATFEGFSVKVPNALETYLTTEYGYLGRDAMYDFDKKCYVKIPNHLYENLPSHMQNQFSH